MFLNRWLLRVFFLIPLCWDPNGFELSSTPRVALKVPEKFLVSCSLGGVIVRSGIAHSEAAELDLLLAVRSYFDLGGCKKLIIYLDGIGSSIY